MWEARELVCFSYWFRLDFFLEWKTKWNENWKEKFNEMLNRNFSDKDIVFSYRDSLSKRLINFYTNTHNITVYFKYWITNS